MIIVVLSFNIDVVSGIIPINGNSKVKCREIYYIDKGLGFTFSHLSMNRLHDCQSPVIGWNSYYIFTILIIPSESMRG